MKYVQPVGAVEDAPYVDANPAAGIEGSPVPAAAIEHPMREIMEVIIRAGLVPDGADLTQLWQALAAAVAAHNEAPDAHTQLWQAVEAIIPGLPIPLSHYTLRGNIDIAGVYDAVAGEFTPPAGTRYVEFLLVGGGGSGNVSSDRATTCGGASGGVLILRVEHLEGAVYGVVVGAASPISTTSVGNTGNATSVACSIRGLLGTALGGEGGRNGHASGGGVSANVPPVRALRGNHAHSSFEAASGDLQGWRCYGAGAPIIGHQGSVGGPTSWGHGGLGRNAVRGECGCAGVVLATVY